MSSACCRHITCCLLALMLLIVRTADAHAHLCDDGKEPPVVIHLADGDSHPCESGGPNGHPGDKDVHIAGDVVLKNPPAADPWITSAISLVFQFAVPAIETRISVESQSVRIATSSHLRPPLRGPPA